MELFLNGVELPLNWANLGILINHQSMNWAQIKDSVRHMSCWCCGSILVSNWRDGRFEPFYCNDKYFCHWIQWKHLQKTPNITNRCSSVYMSQCVSYFAVPLVAVRLNYKSVTKSLYLLIISIKVIFIFSDNINALFLSDELFIYLTFPEYSLSIFIVLF